MNKMIELNSAIKWDLTQEDKVLIYTKLHNNSTYQRAFNPKFDLTNDTLDYITKYGKAPTNHYIITIAGRTGCGKSTIGLILMTLVHAEKTDINQIVFSHFDQKTALKTLGKNITIMRDEQTVRVGVGSRAEGLEIQNWDETLRKDGINFIYIAPTERFHGTARKNLEFVCMCKRKRISKFALYHGSERKKVYTGHCLFKVPTAKQWVNNIWTKYNRKKDRFNKATREDNQSVNWKEYINEIKNHKEWHKQINYNDLQFIITDLYLNQPTALRTAILQAYQSKVGLKQKKRKIPQKPEECKYCGSKFIQFYPSLDVWKCRKCTNSLD